MTAMAFGAGADIWHQLYGIWLLASVICHRSSVICHQSSVFWLL